jgi:hypothetical protein
LAGFQVTTEAPEGPPACRVPFPAKPYAIFSIAHWIATELTYRRETLLWITEHGIWPGSENWQLYYRLRQSYHDERLLQEAPGHLFLTHETEDLASFLQLSLLNGWGGYVLTDADYANLFFSHDEFIDFYSKNGPIDEFRAAWGSGVSAAPTCVAHSVSIKS